MDEILTGFKLHLRKILILRKYVGIELDVGILV